MITMKRFIILFVAVVALVEAEDEWKPIIDGETWRRLHLDCVKENALTPEQIAKVYNKEHPDEEEVRGHVLCSLKRIGVFSEDKGFSIERLMAQFDSMFYDAEKSRDIVTNCVDNNEQNSPAAVWAYRGHQCMVNMKIGEILNKRKNFD